MTRTALPGRRGNVTQRVTHTWVNGKEQHLLVTFGYDDRRKIRELFCADFKEGNDMHTLIGDACVAISLLLQHGHSAQDVSNKMAPAPQSLLKTMVDAAITLEKDL